MSTEPLDLEAIEGRVNAATGGPWIRTYEHTVEGHDGQYLTPVVDDDPDETPGVVRAEDASFIAHAREDVPALIARVRTAETAVGYWRTQVLASRAATRTPVHCPSCDGYQTAVMEDGQRSVGPCEGIASRTVETAEEWEYAWTDSDGEMHEESNPERAMVCAKAAGGKFLRSRPRAWETFREPVQPTPEEADTARECGNDSHHGYGTGYCGDCEKEADRDDA